MTQIGRHDDVYLSTPLEQKLAWFQNAPGLSAVEPARQFMSGAAALYTDSDAKVRATMRGLGADWIGDAATNAGATLQHAADWSQGAGASHGVGGETVEGYGRSFEALRGQVHWDDPWAWGWNDTASAVASVATLSPAPFLGNLTADYFSTAQQNRTNDATAVAALRAHEEQARTAVEGFPRIEPAQISPETTPGAHSGGAGPGSGLPASGAVSGAGHGDGGATGAPAIGAGLAGPVAAAVAGTGAVGNGGVVPAAGAGGRVGRSGATGAAIPGEADGGAPNAAAGATGGVGGVLPGGGGAALGGPGATPGGARATPRRTGVPPGEVGTVHPDGRVDGLRPGNGAGPGGASDAVPGSVPRLRGGLDASGGVREAGPLRLPTGADDAAGRIGVGLGSGSGAGGSGSGTAGGWRDVVARPSSEPGLISRGPTAGPEFAARLPSGVGAGGSAAEGAGMPFLGGMGVGPGAQTSAHRNTYWVRSAEPFDVSLPPHSDGVLRGGDA